MDTSEMEPSEEKEFYHHQHCLKAFCPYLFDQLSEALIGILALEFKFKKIFSNEQHRKIHDLKGAEKRTSFICEFEDATSHPKCYKTFKNTMEKNNAAHIIEYIEGEVVDKHIILKLWQESLGESYLIFQEEFDPKTVLLNHGRELFDLPTLDKLKAINDRSVQVNEFFVHVTKKQDWFPTLIKALNYANLQYFAEYLDPEENLRGAAFVFLVEACNCRFEEILNPVDILDKMPCLSNATKDYITEMKCRKKQVKALLNILTSQEGPWFKELVAALNSCIENPEYQKLAETLDPSCTREQRRGHCSVKTRIVEYMALLHRRSRLEPLLISFNWLEQDFGITSPSDDTSTTPKEPSSPTELGTYSEAYAEEANTREVKGEGIEPAAVTTDEENAFSSELDESTKLPETRESPIGSESESPGRPPIETVRGSPRAFVDHTEPVDVHHSRDETAPLKVNTPSLETTNLTSEHRRRNANELSVTTNVSTDLNITEPLSPDINEDNVFPIESPSVRKEVLALRDYQLELAKPALEGKNCMIVAPTGSGKTFVALYACIKHLEKTQNPKIVFLVPRVPLVKQQFELFKRFVDEKYKMFSVTGEMNSAVPVHISVERHTVIIMTAQILVNLISDGLLDISHISLLIFDECHHAVKNEPYNQIMRGYLDKRFENKNAKLPQVVGLTASPGMGKAKTMAKAHENIKTLMANLDVTTAPVQVRMERGNLTDFQHEAQDEIITVNRRTTADIFFVQIKKIMKEIERRIENHIIKSENVLEGRIQFDLRAAHGTQDYEAWAITLLNKSKLIDHDETRQRFMAYAQHLHVYNNSLMLNDHVRSVDAKDYISRSLFEERLKRAHALDDELKMLYDEQEPRPSSEDNPLLVELTRKLKEEFRVKPNSRCIIFVKTRAIARALLTYLTENLSRLNPKQLTGAGAQTDSFGMTKVGQDDNLSAFREGTCKVLVATSVAEEGLDIKECNLIITYNYSTNEVGQVQRRGRGRAKDSKIIMLAYGDSGHVKRERENAIRVQLTQDILTEIHSLPPDVLVKDIRRIQEKLHKNREFDKTVEQYRSKQKRPNYGVFRLSCLWCKRHVTESNKFKVINKQHRVVVDREFPSRAEFRQVPDSEAQLIGDEHFLIGKIFCKNMQCRRLWGLRMRYKNFPISVLRIENFLITNDKGYRAVKKKWKDAPFVVKDELTREHLKELLGPVAEDDDDDEFEDDPDLGANLNFD